MPIRFFPHGTGNVNPLPNRLGPSFARGCLESYTSIRQIHHLVSRHRTSPHLVSGPTKDMDTEHLPSRELGLG